jgi:arylformamidase
MKIYDVSLHLHDGLASWPGDAPYRFHWSWERSKGASVNVGQASLSVHAGTHADAPYHFDDNGATIEAVPLTAYLGPACVIDVRGQTIIQRETLTKFDPNLTPRLLLRTEVWTDHSRFPESIPIIAPDVPDWLGKCGVVLLGVDVPSVDAIDSKDLVNHHALGRHGIAILESLFLKDVPEGIYELIALPLRLTGADGAPVRAILRAPA